jgi:cell division protein FtsW
MLCLAVLIPGVGVEVNGARRWLGLGPVRVQPSEFAKWGVVLFLAWRLSRPGPFTLQSFLTTCGVVGGVCLLVVIEDFGTAALIGLTAGFLMLVGPVRLRWLLAATIPAGAAAFGFVYSEPYRWRRIVAFLDPWAAPETDGYHVIQSLYSFAGGGWTGRGLGNGVQKLGYLPEDATDFIFAVVCEELGIFGAGLVVLAYLTLLAAGLGVAAKATHGFGRLLAFGVVATLGLQAATNIAVATASVPTKGIPLPLVSAGGTGLVCTAVMLGLVVAVARQQDTTPVVVEPDEDESED